MNLAFLLSLLRSDPHAARVVPPSGFTARLTVFAAGAMAFLAVFALALSLASGRLASRWSADLSKGATLRISAALDERAAQTVRALEVLRQTPGIADARALSASEQAALLAPWFGAELSLDGLPVPQLIEIHEERAGFDAAGLRLRLAAEVPGAVLDDHVRWRRPLARAAGRLRLLGFGAMLLIAGAVAAMISLAANAALAANAQVIDVLGLVGARDSYIANAFVRRFTLRALIGGAIGTGAGLLALLLLPSASAVEGGVLTGLGLGLGGWLLAALIPLLIAIVALIATARATRRVLTDLA